MGYTHGRCDNNAYGWWSMYTAAAKVGIGSINRIKSDMDDIKIPMIEVMVNSIIFHS
jgi:hypothetical protein